MAVCRNCGTRYQGNVDLCAKCLVVSPACRICGRQLDDHGLMYSKDKYPKPVCPRKGADVASGEEVA